MQKAQRRLPDDRHPIAPLHGGNVTESATESFLPTGGMPVP